MGILKGREELIPVTCAILKDADRDAFFSQIRKNRAGSPEALAQWLGVPVGLINEWIKGKIHIPYHTLQNIAYQFSLEMPPVGELRRESVPAAHLPSTKPPEPTPIPRPTSKGRPIREKKPRPTQVERPRPQKINQERPVKKGPVVPQGITGGHWPKPSEALAYWAGILYAAAQVEADVLSFSADRRIGQNFAGIWARKTKELFGITSQLSMLEEGKVQQAKCEIPGVNKYLSRFCPGAGTRTDKASLPRWIWSNPNWKSAYLKGLADVSARFQRQPAIVLDLSPGLKNSAQKLLTSLGFKPPIGQAGSLLIAGREELERYFTSIGTENMKLRDQWTSYCRGGAEAIPETAGDQETQTSASPGTPEGKPASAPAHRRRPARPRRTIYRGRPGQ